jgi:Ca2+/Na+ antiporter
VTTLVLPLLPEVPDLLDELLATVPLLVLVSALVLVLTSTLLVDALGEVAEFFSKKSMLFGGSGKLRGTGFRVIQAGFLTALPSTVKLIPM